MILGMYMAFFVLLTAALVGVAAYLIDRSVD